MQPLLDRTTLSSLGLLACILLSANAEAQTQPPTQSFPQPAPVQPQPAPPGPAPAQPPPQGYPQQGYPPPQQQPPPQGYPQQQPPPQGYPQQQPPPQGYPQQPPAQGYPPPQQQPPPQGYPPQQPPPGQQGYPPYAQQPPPGEQPPPTYASEPPLPAPPPPQAPQRDSKFRIPDFSVRVDPLNWLIYGRLGVQLEVEALEWLTVQTVPIFVASQQPPAFNFEQRLYQESNGWGPLAGASLGAGFWLGGDSFNGNVLRVALNSYSYRHLAKVDGQVVDSVREKQTRLAVLLGSHSTWGFFTIAGALGFEYEFNKDRRCIVDIGTVKGPSTDGCDKDQLELSLNGLGNSGADVYNVRPTFYPVDLVFRLSLGAVFE